MDKAIKILEQKRKEWRLKVEEYRLAMMKAHVEQNYSERETAEQLGHNAIEVVQGLDYAIALLKGE